MLDGETVYLSLADEDLSRSRMAEFGREVAGTLNRQPGMEASVATGGAGAGTKGEWEEVGLVALKLLGSGGAVTVLLNGLKSYFLRRQKLVIDVVRADKTKFKLTAENLSTGQFDQTYAMLSHFLDGA